jgi:NAD(P)-dependent dehydrogenase (short-subunit alcohol dehydrogenase family)
MTDRFDGATILVTGANGGLGREFVRQGLDRGARRVYAAARTPQTWEDPRVVPLRLDLTDLESIAAAAQFAPDVDLLVNNAAIAPAADQTLLSTDEDVARAIFDTNFFGPVRVTRAFAPVLAAHGGGAILNVLSLASWAPVPTAYAASKAAAWSASNATRIELAAQGTAVTGLIVGMVDTAMSHRFELPKSDPAEVVAQAYDGVAAGALEVLADEDSRQVKALLSGPVEAVDAAIAEALAALAS